jgi:hypothetical protein
MAIRLAKHPRPQNRELRWDTLLTAERNRGEDQTDTTRTVARLEKANGGRRQTPPPLDITK